MPQSKKYPPQAEEWRPTHTSKGSSTDVWLSAGINYLAAGRNHPLEPHIHQDEEVDQALWSQLIQVLIAFLLLTVVLAWLA